MQFAYSGQYHRTNYLIRKCVLRIFGQYGLIWTGIRAGEWKEYSKVSNESVGGYSKEIDV